ncbi:MAG: FAD-dependent oxidoreductase [Deltaproteobacteria bacterium]|nr:FAD-dependent oxidoreductase [Deltaproteobacteria bacterium]
MSHSKYLIVGSSHAGLSALEAIRTHDTEGSITLITQEVLLPYSPTILPYVLSGQVDKGQVFLMDKAALDRYGVAFMQGKKLVGVDPASRSVSLESGESLEYENLLLVTGAEPSLPPIPGLKEAPFHVLRTMEDVLRLRKAVQNAESAIVMGAGLIGMHAAENLFKEGLQVIVVEALPQVLPGYFDDQAAGLIRKAFTEQGLNIFTESMVTHVSSSNGDCDVTLESGKKLSADLIMVATGVKPRMAYLDKSGIEVDNGILVDDTMKTSMSHIWAAGDVAQARSFFDSEKNVHANLPTAIEQGRIAGLDMSGDPALRPYPGGIPMNTYKFFDHRSFSIGLANISQSEKDIEVDQLFHPTSMQYQRLIYTNDCLVGVSSINTMLDPGIMYQLIQRRVDLGEVKKAFAASPLETGRILMSKIWG